jgi:poly-gamma-glutamate synthesis protein (capsule biosynthesis protein)
MIFLGDIAHPFQVPPTWTYQHPPWQQQPAIVNFEGALSNDLRILNSRRLFNHPSILPALDSITVKIASLANNHILDLPQCFAATVEALAARGIAVVGAGRDIDEARRPAVLEHDGRCYSVIAFGWSPIGCRAAQERGAGVNPLLAENVLRSVSECRRRSPDGKLYVLMHWNFEMELYPQPAHRQLAMAAIEAGADAVIGHHPHRVAGLEFHRGMPIAYSLGNWWLPHGLFFGGSVSYGEEANLQLALESGSSDDVTCHWFSYDSHDHSLHHRGSEPARQSARVKTLTPFQGMNHGDYKDWFAGNRVKRRGLPVYWEADASAANELKDRYVKLRHAGLRLLEMSGLRELAG